MAGPITAGRTVSLPRFAGDFFAQSDNKEGNGPRGGTPKCAYGRARTGVCLLM